MYDLYSRLQPLARNIGPLLLRHLLQEPLGKLADEIAHVPEIAPLDDLPVLELVHRGEANFDGFATLEDPLLGVVEEDDVAVNGNAVGCLVLLREVIPGDR